MEYGSFKRFSLDPQNEGEVLEKAITRAFQASSGRLNAFNAGSPLVVLLEALVFTQMEFLFWLNSMPEAMILTYMAEVLGAGRSYGVKATATVQVTLTQPLASLFLLNAGTSIYSKNNAEIAYSLVDSLVIPAGQITGFVLAEATKAGTFSQVAANELTVIAENYAYLKEVNNPSPSTLGSNFENLTTTAERVLSIMSQTTPVSGLDWLNIIELSFPGRLAEVKNADGVLYLYIQDYVFEPTFEAYCHSVKGLLQTIEIAPYKKALLQIKIAPEKPLGPESCLFITKALSSFLEKAKPLQPIDLYKAFIDLNPTANLLEFDVLYYYQGIEPGTRFQGIELQPFDYVGGQVLKEVFTSDYYVVNSSFNAIVSALDESELGYLNYSPVYENSGPGEYTVNDIVKINSNYYLITASGNFDPATTANWTILSAPQTWSNNLAVTTADWFLEPSPVSGLLHGFIPAFSYVTTSTISSNISPITPLARVTSQAVSPGEYFYITGFEQVLYYNNLTTTYNVSSPVTVDQVEVYKKPNPFYTKLTRRSKYTVGNITADKNYIFTASNGTKVPIATGQLIPGYIQFNEPSYGTFILDNKIVYEVLEAFVPNSLDTIQSLLTAGTIKKAYRKYTEYETISPSFYTPFYFDIDFVLFDQQNELVVSKVNNTYSVN